MIDVNFNNVPEFVGRIYSDLQELKEAVAKRLPKPAPPKNALTTPEALELLATIGYPTTIYNLNKKCSLGHLDGLYRIVGRNRIFDRKKLTQWVEHGCPNMNELKATDHLQKQVQ